MIIHWEFNHFVVLEGVMNNKVYINDPAMGKRVIEWKQFETSFTGVAISIKPNENFKREGKPYNIFVTVGKKLA